ncbi:hypothetical protein LCGC14_2275330 [marine sediment metagenome]|uniref:Uncharacterized protein n=1 Tax=marine sediment metagenome TaxID=412755 RepID=A0A0F9DHY1_9ZZZZ
MDCNMNNNGNKDLTTVEGIVDFLSKESDRLWDEYKKYYNAAHDDMINFRKTSNQHKSDMAYGGHAKVYGAYTEIRDANAVKDKGLTE